MLKRRSTRARGRVRGRIPVLAAVVAVTCSLLAGAGTALADEEPPPVEMVGPNTGRWVVPEKVEVGHVDWNRMIGYCIVGDPNSGCGMTQTATVSYTVSGELGVSSEILSASLGVERSESLAVAINCNIRETEMDTRYVAYATFSRHYFHVMEETGMSPGGVPSINQQVMPFSGIGETVRYPTTYVDIPDGNVACRVRPQR